MAITSSKQLHESSTRSLCKALSWRVFGSIATGSIVFVATGNVSGAFIVGGAEFVMKIGLYYLHERLWDSISIGRVEVERHESLRLAANQSVPTASGIRAR